MRPIEGRMRIAIQVIAFASLAAGHAICSYADPAPASKATAARGEELVRQLCTSCHVVAVDQEFPPILRQKTPTFMEIANRPDITAASLQHFLSTTHWDEKTIPMQMPNPGLRKEEMTAVTAYILSLHKP